MSNNNRRTQVNSGNASRKTTPNEENAKRKTMINSGDETRKTAVNAVERGRKTALNTEEVEQQAHTQDALIYTAEDERLPEVRICREGDRIAQYTVKRILNPTYQTGEAVIYLCTDEAGQDIALKYYRRTNINVEEKSNLAERLNKIDGVQKTLDMGEDNGHFYEVMPYYRHGSLKDRMNRRLFTEDEIKKDVLPKLVKILEDMHNAAIFHGDIKPENIMYADDGKSLIIIDFGISVITSEGNKTVYRAVDAGTADYRAPETHHGTIVDASDYYSLGITLYTLMAGKTPTEHLAGEEDVQSAQALNAIPRLNSMSDQMYTLIDGLTYESVRYRHDRSKANRWIAEDVHCWLNDQNYKPEHISIPIIRDMALNIPFNNKLYTSWPDVLLAMAGKWNEGKKFLLSTGIGTLRNSISKNIDAGNDQLRKTALLNFQHSIDVFLEEIKNKGYEDDEIFFMFLYSFSDGDYGWGIEPIFWKGMAFKDASALGEAIYDSALKDAPKSMDLYGDLFYDSELLEQYFEQLPNKNKIIEKCRGSIADILESEDGFEALMDCCFVLRNEKTLRVSQTKTIKSPAEFKRYIMDLGKDLQTMQKQCNAFISKDGGMYTILNCWLKYHGVTDFRKS